MFIEKVIRIDVIRCKCEVQM